MLLRFSFSSRKLHHGTFDFYNFIWRFGSATCWLHYSNEEVGPSFAFSATCGLTTHFATPTRSSSGSRCEFYCSWSFNLVNSSGCSSNKKPTVIAKTFKCNRNEFLCGELTINFFFRFSINSTSRLKCARSANATECPDPARWRPAGCACLTSASSATRLKIASMGRREFKSATAWGTATRIRSPEATDETRTSHRTPTTWERRTLCIETDKITRSRTGKKTQKLSVCPWTHQLFLFHSYKFSLKPYNPDHKPPTPKDLVYFEQSPGFCEKNLRLGILGTHGRQCNDTSIGVDGCDLMCCGRGYRTQEVIVFERCACTFHWCCEVKCKTCRTKKTIHTCL